MGGCTEWNFQTFHLSNLFNKQVVKFSPSTTEGKYMMFTCKVLTQTEPESLFAAFASHVCRKIIWMNKQSMKGNPNRRYEKINDESDESELRISVCFHLHFQLSLSGSRSSVHNKSISVNSLRRCDSSMLKANNTNKIVLKTLSTKSFQFSRRLNV